MEKKNVVFLTVLAIATLLTAVVGTTFAYFTATVTGNDTATTTTIQTANLSVAYSDGAQINATGIAPGWVSQTTTYSCSTGTVSGTKCVDGSNQEIGDATAATQTGKTISVTNNSSVSVDYTINWTAVSNGFVTVASKDPTTGDYETGAATTPGSSDFVYRLYRNSVDPANIVGSETAVPTAAGELTHGTLASGATDTYVLVMEFKETNIKQNENQGKSFSAKLQTTVANLGS